MRVGVLLFALLLPTLAAADEWTTYYEQSDYKETPNYQETVRYCKKLADASDWIQYTTFGVSPQGRDLPLLIVNKNGHFTSDAVRASDHVVFLIQAGIHSGEIDGKDAGLMLIRDMVIKGKDKKWLDHVTILFMPIFSVDGHERTSPYNRANQNGPASMGWRATSTGLNLNRDYLKADAPEMRDWLRLYREWLPEFFADCHVTDGADYQYVVTYALETFGNMDANLTAWTEDKYRDPLKRSMKKAGYPIIRYNSYLVRHEPRSGIASWAAPPRFSEGYTAIQNRPGILVETHMLKDYKTRVTGTYELLKSSIEILSKEYKDLKQLCADADARTSSAEFRADPFPLTHSLDSTSTVRMKFLGVEYEVRDSDVTGGKWHIYSDKKVEYEIPYYNKQTVTSTAQLPEAYIVPPEWTDVIDRMTLHGIEIQRLKEATTMTVSSYRLDNSSWESRPYEGRHRVTMSPVAIEEERTYPAGSVLVDMNQRAARVAAHILEPGGPDSFVYWGFFDTVFERKEYIESYVIEKLAREMLESDAELRAEFEAKKKAEPDFAANPQWIRHWFYQRTPYWDNRISVYPVGRIMERDAVGGLAIE